MNVEAMIAGLALIVTVWTVWLDARSRRLSVTPHLAITRHSRELDGTHEFNVQNQGVGPAIIERMALTYNGLPVALSRQGVSDWNEAHGHPDFIITYSAATPGTFIATGHVFVVLGLSIGEGSGYSGTDLAHLCSPFTLTIRYRSLYGDRFTEVSAPFHL